MAGGWRGGCHDFLLRFSVWHVFPAARKLAGGTILHRERESCPDSLSFDCQAVITHFQGRCRSAVFQKRLKRKAFEVRMENERSRNKKHFSHTQRCKRGFFASWAKGKGGRKKEKCASKRLIIFRQNVTFSENFEPKC